VIFSVKRLRKPMAPYYRSNCELLSLTSAIVDSATKLSFRKVCQEVEKYTAGVISSSTVHCLLQRVAQSAIDEEKA